MIDLAKRSTPAPPPGLNAEYVLGLYESKVADGDEARLRTIASTCRALTRLEHEPKIPKQYRAITSSIKTPFVRDTWLRSVAALTGKPMVVHLEPRNKTEDARRAANIAEKWDLAAVDALNGDAGIDLVAEDTKALVRDGESVAKIVHRPEAWANFPGRDPDEDAESYSRRADEYKQNAPLPLAWREVDRLSMLFGDGEFGDEWALEYGEYPLPYLSRRYGMPLVDGKRLVNPQNTLGGRPKPRGYLRSSTGHAVKVEYFEADWWHVVVDGEDAPGFPKPNPYAPDLPYFRAKASDSESMLFSLMYLVPALDSLLTMKTNWAYLGAYPTPVIKSASTALTAGMVETGLGDDQQPSKVKYTPGKSIELPDGKTIEFLAPPPVGKDLDELAAILRQLIDVAGIPSILRGGGTSATSGYQANQMLAAAMMMFRLAALSQRRKFERMFEFMHRLIPRRIKQTAYVSGTTGEGNHYLGLKASGSCTATEAPVDLLGPVKVDFTPTLPTDEQAQAMIANQLVNSPKALISLRYGREKYLHIEDPEGMQDEIWVEDALDHDPQLNQLVVSHAIDEAGFGQRQQNPAAALVAPNGQPLLPGNGGGMPPEGMTGVPGQIAGGIPAVAGLNMPIQPPGPTRAPIRKPGAYPGQPGGVPAGTRLPL